MYNIQKLYALVLKHPLRHLLLLGLLIRVLILVIYQGVSIFPDSRAYIDLSQYIANLSLDNYSGGRTPGFPLLIALTNKNLIITIIIQQIIGLINICLIYDFSLNKTQNKTISFWITFITITFLHFNFYELAILTETLSLFLLLLSFWIIQKYKLLTSNGKLIFFIFLSITMSFLYLTRPMFIYFPLLFIIFFIIKNFKQRIKRIVLPVIVIFTLSGISFYSWCSLNKKNIGYFSSTYYFGYNLTQMATSFFDLVPEEHKEIRDIFIKHRTFIEKNKSHDVYPMTVWYAADDLLELTNLKTQDLSNKLGKISIELFKEYPHLYLKQVLVSWKSFWGTESTFLLNKEKFKYKIPKYLVYGIWKIIQQYILILINILFILFSIKKIFQFVTLKFKIFDFDLFLVIVVMGGSVAQALVAYGDNSRFCFPYLPLIVYFVITNLFLLKTIIPKANAKNITA
ncbi:hypothetical protein [Flavivirga algicola]|uniref:Glycosyltransferase RgtA/B/C/D-like domain-containing protein n=1 Tax=Flavivirga algicola TaxID=2729136 RepID=A0ABX1RWR0_9FLAO|nr:hypothetical protein [Flavivirga algicola]NMH88020.1 hypothetical protein [Flavivirga algicola]